MKARPPGPLSRLLFRLPVWLYRAKMGWVLDGRFLLLAHVGRRTGRMRQAVLEVIDFDAEQSMYFVASAWGDKADWFRNIAIRPDVEITVGRRKMRALADILSPGESRRILREYGRRHRIAAAALTRLFGYSGFDAIAESVPAVAFRSGVRGGSNRGPGFESVF
ncbi:MAG: nitroreductase family deazaflavin-dependent oxidoreductase [Chloroflexi bacterium]|nr:nitroreductase family deazaflavin-dependent oxidoreductase [Chloroflexota bacterium]